MARLLVNTLALLCASPVLAQQLPSVSPEQMEKLRTVYLQRLNTWVASRDLSKVQSEVVQNCGKMMYLRDPTMGTATAKDLKEALDLRIDVCTKMTVHRVEPQPEFSNPAILKITCGDLPKEEPVFTRLCAVAKLKG